MPAEVTLEDGVLDIAVSGRELKPEEVARGLKAGTVWVNTYNSLAAGAAFGGYKKSGFGRECAFETLMHYTQTKSVYINTPGKKTGGR